MRSRRDDETGSLPRWPHGSRMIGEKELQRIELAIAIAGVEEAAAVAFAAIVRLGELEDARQALVEAVAIGQLCPDVSDSYERGWSVVVG